VGIATLRRFVVWFAPIALLLCLSSYLFYRQEVAHEASLLRADQRHAVEREKRRFESTMEDVASDILVLAQSPAITSLTGHADKEQMETAVRSLMGMGRNKPTYAQLRYLDARGRELIRIQRGPGGVYPVAGEELQDKSERYYVQEGLKLGHGQVYVSRLDLNVEEGRVEEPPRPMLRFVAPVRDSQGGMRGLVVINYDASSMLEGLDSAWLARGHVELVDHEGWWLVGRRPAQLWGFMLPGREDYRLDRRYPGLWRAIKREAQGQLFAGPGLVTFAQVSPPRHFGPERIWYLLAVVPPRELDQALGVYLRPLLPRLAGLLLAAALASWLLARTQVLHRIAEVKVRRDAENQRALRGLLGLRLSSGPIAHILAQALETVFSVSWLGTIPKGGVFLTRPGEPPELELVAQRGLDPHIKEMCASVAWGRCHCGRAAATGELQHCRHVDQTHENRYPGMPDHGHYNLPLMKGDRCLGVMVLYLDAGQDYHEEDAGFLEAAGGILAGILESREREEAVAESEARLRAVVDTAVEGIITIDTLGTVLAFNPAAESIFGYTAAEVLGNNVSMLQPADVAREHGGYIQRYLSTGEAHIIGIGREVTGRRKDGSLFPLYLSVSELRLGRGMMFTGILRDISQRKEAERCLREAKEQTETANRELLAKQSLLDQDLEAAAGIQQALLPSEPPQRPELDLAWRFIPSQHVGGDMLSVSELTPGVLGLYLLDVSGHGVPSALVTVSVHEMLSRSSGHVVQYREDGGVTVADPRWVADLLDQEYPLERFDKFFTMFYAVLDTNTGRLTYTNAGHPAPWLFRAGGGVDILEQGGTVIGMGLEGGYDQGEAVLQPGDRLFCYTDGITEHAAPSGQFYGEQRLLAALEQGREQTLDHWLSGVLKEAMDFGGHASPVDDISLLALEYRG
jgi:sigma-B regulation protein RsbU (phosphoserine phosphatase)